MSLERVGFSHACSGVRGEPYGATAGNEREGLPSAHTLRRRFTQNKAIRFTLPAQSTKGGNAHAKLTRKNARNGKERTNTLKVVKILLKAHAYSISHPSIAL